MGIINWQMPPVFLRALFPGLLMAVITNARTYPSPRLTVHHPTRREESSRQRSIERVPAGTLNSTMFFCLPVTGRDGEYLRFNCLCGEEHSTADTRYVTPVLNAAISRNKYGIPFSKCSSCSHLTQLAKALTSGQEFECQGCGRVTVIGRQPDRDQVVISGLSP
jgi:hypothetical protein